MPTIGAQHNENAHASLSQLGKTFSHPATHLQRGGRQAVVLAQEVPVVALQAQVQQVGAVVPGGGVGPAGRQAGIHMKAAAM